MEMEGCIAGDPAAVANLGQEFPASERGAPESLAAVEQFHAESVV